MPGVDGVLFDCWGTLFLNVPAEGPAVPMYALAEGLGVEVDAAFRDAYERAFMLAAHDGYAGPVRRLATAVGVDPDDATVDRLVRRLHALNGAQAAFDDAAPALDALRDRGLALALVTNTDAASLAALRAEFPVDDRFDAVVPSYEVGALKPDPAPFETALDRLGLPPARAAMVGDSPGSDVAAARRLGMRAVLVDRADAHPGRSPRVTSLADLPGLL
jgi:putative hydrolase of the HAD superfamily